MLGMQHSQWTQAFTLNTVCSEEELNSLQYAQLKAQIKQEKSRLAELHQNLFGKGKPQLACIWMAHSLSKTIAGVGEVNTLYTVYKQHSLWTSLCIPGTLFES